jgi:hypothetical protein
MTISHILASFFGILDLILIISTLKTKNNGLAAIFIILLPLPVVFYDHFVWVTLASLLFISFWCFYIEPRLNK